MAGTDSGAGPGLGPGAGVRRPTAPLASPPSGADRGLLPRSQPGGGRQGTRHPARHGQITHALRAACAAPAAARERRDRVLIRSRARLGVPAAASPRGTASPAAGRPIGLRLIAAMLIGAAGPGSRPLQPGSDDIPAYRPDSRAGRGRNRRGRTQPDCCARVPGRPALGGLDSAADRRRVSAASVRVRLPKPVHDPRRGNRRPWSPAGRSDPGHRRPRACGR